MADKSESRFSAPNQHDFDLRGISFNITLGTKFCTQKGQQVTAKKNISFFLYL